MNDDDDDDLKFHSQCLICAVCGVWDGLRVALAFAKVFGYKEAAQRLSMPMTVTYGITRLVLLPIHQAASIMELLDVRHRFPQGRAWAADWAVALMLVILISGGIWALQMVNGCLKSEANNLCAKAENSTI